MTNRYESVEHYELAYEWFKALDEGQPTRYLAKICGVSQRAISEWRRGEEKPDWKHYAKSERMRAQIKELLDDGQSHYEISRTLNTTPRTIRTYFPGTAWTKEQQAEYRTALRQHGRVIYANAPEPRVVRPWMEW